MRFGTTLIAVLLLFAVNTGLAETQFGPGDHWLDTVSPDGSFIFDEVLVAFGVDTDFDGNPDFDVAYMGSPLTVGYTAAMDVSALYPSVGTVDGHNDVSDLELLSATLPGISLYSLGTTLRVGKDAGVSSVPAHAGDRPSYGVAVELTSDPALAESFFDLYFEVDGALLMEKLHNDDPLRITSVIDRAPPPGGTVYSVDTAFMSGAGTWPLPLYDANDIHVANLTNLFSGDPAQLVIVPEPSSFALSAIALIGFLGFFRRRAR